MWGCNFNDKCILHCDLNNFFASVELLEHPELKNVPVCVGGDEKARHGIILAKNEIAKKYGIKTGEPLSHAKEKCPFLKILLPHFDKYSKYSKLVKKIYMRYTDQVESFGIDECWLDVSNSRFLFGDGVTIANKIRESVKEETGLTISVGVSFNKIFAKLGSDLKKPNAVTEISKDNFKEKIYTLPCSHLFGVGKSTETILVRHGIYTIGDLAKTNEKFIRNILGKNGITLLNYARGYDDMPVAHKDFKPICKSISQGCTTAFDLTDESSVKQLILKLSENVCEKMLSANFCAKKVQITVKDTGLESVSYSKTSSVPIISTFQISQTASELLISNYDLSKHIRAISVCVCDLYSNDFPFQLDLYTNYNLICKISKKEKVAFDIKKKMGENSITRASLLNSQFERPCAIYEFNPFEKNFMR